MAIEPPQAARRFTKAKSMLNRCLVEDEAQGRTVTGPGLPPGFDPKDPRWYSEDCIQPPPLSE